jgi:hypothetical protein
MDVTNMGWHILPSLIHLPTLLEDGPRQTFSQAISLHFSSANFLNVEVSLGMVVPKPVPFDQVVLSPIGDALSAGKQIGSLVIL